MNWDLANKQTSKWGDSIQVQARVYAKPQSLESLCCVQETQNGSIVILSIFFFFALQEREMRPRRDIRISMEA